MGLILGVAIFVVVGSIAYVFVSEDRSKRRVAKLAEVNEDVKEVNEEVKSVNKDFEPVRLFYACEYKDWDMLKSMLKEHSIDVNVKNYNGNTILFFACKSGDINLVKYIVEKVKVDCYTINRFGENILFTACNDINMLKYFIEDKKVDFNVINVFGENILFNACRNGSKAALEYLIEEKKMDIGLVNKYGKNLFDISSFETEDYIGKKLNINYRKGVKNSMYKEMLSDSKVKN